MANNVTPRGRSPLELSGGADPSRDQHDRELRTVRRGGELLAEMMVARRLAEGSGWDWERVDWCGGGVGD